MNVKNLSKLALAVAVAFPMMASAESNFVTGAATTTPGAQARLDFQVTIPKVLYLQVGTGTYFTNVATVNGVTFTVPAANVGDSGAIAGSASVAVRVVGNNGNITLNATTLGALGNGSGDTISYTQIVGSSDNANLAHPAAFVDGGTSANVTVTPNIGSKVTDRTANWSFNYSNTAVVPPGTYGGVNANNSRVTYTATMP
ncbi:MAG TPA: hypothetical protein PLD37_03185 [Usitatibacteraceae bacterium]|nr:hypothetical protein [Usitatibacteraceae bacterium]